MPRDRVTGESAGYAFVEFATEKDAEYAANVLNGIKLFGKPIKVALSATNLGKSLDIGANLFIGGLDEGVDENMLREVFSAFGYLVGLPQITRDNSKGTYIGYAFLAFDTFDAADAAISAMNDQYLLNKQIKVQYAFKKGTTERHGSAEERLLANKLMRNLSGLPPQSQPYASGANSIPVNTYVPRYQPPPPNPYQAQVNYQPNFFPPPPR